MQTPIILATGPASTGSIRYFGPALGSTQAVAPNGTLVSGCPMPVAGNLSKLRLRCVTALTAGRTYVLTVLKNGSTQSLLVTADDTHQLAVNDTDVVSYNPGDILGFKMEPSGTPEAQASFAVSALFSSITANRCPLFASHATTASTSSMFLQVGGGIAAASTESKATVRMPVAGTIDSIYVKLSAAPGTGVTVTYTPYKNGVAQSGSSVSVTDTNTTNSTTAITPVSYSAGDTISIERTVSGGTPVTAVGNLGIEFRPTTDGEAPLLGLWLNGGNVASTRYGNANGNTGANGTESAAYQVAPGAFEIRSIYTSVVTAPGAAASGKKWTFTLRNATADSALTTDILETATTNNASSTISIADNAIIDTKVAPTSTPTASGDMSVSYVSYIAPSYPSSGGGLCLMGVG